MKPTLAGSRCIPTARRRDSFPGSASLFASCSTLILLTWSVAAVALEGAPVDVKQDRDDRVHRLRHGSSRGVLFRCLDVREGGGSR